MSTYKTKLNMLFKLLAGTPKKVCRYMLPVAFALLITSPVFGDTLYFRSSEDLGSVSNPPGAPAAVWDLSEWGYDGYDGHHLHENQGSNEWEIQSEKSATNNVTFERFVSGALDSHTISSGETWSVSFGMEIDNVNQQTCKPAARIYLINSDGTEQDVIVSFSTISALGNGGPLTVTPINGVTNASDINVQTGDRIVVDIGYREEKDSGNRYTGGYFNAGTGYGNAYLNTSHTLPYLTYPTINSVSPDASGQGASGRSIVIEGSDFNADDVIKFVDGLDSETEVAGVNLSNKNVYTSSITLDMSVDHSVAAGSYAIRVQRAAMGSTIYDDIAFNITEAPTSAINSQTHNDIYSAVESIAGTANSPSASPENISIRIRQVETGNYWTGSNWGGDSGTWLDGGAIISGGWSWDSTGVDWAGSNYPYRITSRATDSNGGVEDVTAKTDFDIFYDNVPPDVSVTSPPDDLYSAVEFTFEGGSQDNSWSYITPFGNEQVEIQIFDDSNTRYWDESQNDWVEDAYWNVATGTSPWTYNLPNWLNNVNYELSARAMDKAGNYSTVFSTSLFTLDQTPPTSGIEQPSWDSAFSSYWMEDTGISGTASDNSRGGINADSNWAVQYAIRLGTSVAGTTWFDGDGFTDYETTDPQWWAMGSDNLSVTGTTPWNEARTLDWMRTFYNYQFNSGESYTLFVRVRDMTDSNYGGPTYQTELSSSVFMIDDDNPVSEVDVPADGSRRSSLNTISGTAFDGESGLKEAVDGVQIRISSGSGAGYWNGVDWQSDSYWLDVSNYSFDGKTMNWEYNSEVISFVNGDEYKINTRAVDRVPNYETNIATVTFVYDTESPQSVITDPDHLSHKTFRGDSLFQEIKGTANGDTENVKIYIQDITRGSTYWNGTDWVEGEDWLDTSGEVIGDIYYWDYGISTDSWSNGHEYGIMAYATDKSTPSANVEDYATKALSRFWWDTEIPDVQLTSPDSDVTRNHLYGPGNNYISGTALDTPEIGILENVEVYVRQRSDGYYLAEDKSGFTETSLTWVDAQQNPNWEDWQFEVPDSSNVFHDNQNTYPGEYYIGVRAVDQAGNKYEPDDISELHLTWDDTPPSVSVSYPASDTLINDSNLTLEGTVSELHEIDYVRTRIYNVDTGQWWTGSGWTDSSEQWPYATVYTSSWSYSGVNWLSGDYQITVKAKDNVEPRTLEGFSAIREFTYDATPPPTNIVTIPVNGSWYNDSLTDYTGETADDKSGMASVDLKIQDLTQGTTFWNGSTWVNDTAEDTWVPVGAPLDFWTYSSLPPHDQNHQYRVTPRAYDEAGNESIGSDYEYRYDQENPESRIDFPADGESYGSISTVSGEADDEPLQHDTFSNIKVKLYDQDANEYYQGDGNWGTIETWVDGAWDVWKSTYLTRNWQWSMPSLSGRDAHSFQLWSKTSDIAGNSETDYEIGTSSLTFEYDPSVPVAQITAPRSNTDQDPELPKVMGESHTGAEYSITDNWIAITKEERQAGGWGSSDSYYDFQWDGSSWVEQDELIWLNASSPAGNNEYWEYTSVPGDWTANVTYDNIEKFEIRSKAKSSKPSEGAPSPPVTFYPATGEPFSYTTSKNHGQVSSEIDIISGEGVGNMPSDVEVAVQKIVNPPDDTNDGDVWNEDGDDLFWDWNNEEWTTSEDWDSASVSGSDGSWTWESNTSSVSWESARY
ncbi:MAG: Ig-like domain repeat protein, partial [Elusimicrobiota bacterium]